MTPSRYKGGGLGKSTGKIVQSTSGGSPHIALYSNGKPSGVSCYLVKKP
jgi:hypothetical protein